MNPIPVSKGLVAISKVDEEQRLVKGVVYKPFELDAHGDWMTPEDIKKMAYQFMEDLNIQEVDTNHDLENVDAFVCESYIAKSADPEGYPEGSWVVVVKIKDDEVWNGVLLGEFNGFSLWGTAIAIDEAEPPIV